MRPIDEFEPETIDNLESDDFFECPGCGDLLVHSHENPDAECSTCNLEGPPAKAEEIIARWRSAPRLQEQVKLLREVAEDARKELEAQAAYFGSHLDPENNLFRILRKLESTLENTKPEGE